jgi:glycosyltransferase involved in cell wall biosynthesis
MRILLWHVHGSWTTAFVSGRHDYLLPVEPERGPDGLGRARTWNWPSSAVEVPVDGLRDVDMDVVVLQRLHEIELVERWTGRRPGADVPAVFVEHNAPTGDVPCSRHPLAGRDDITVVHVTNFNDAFWDTGRAPTAVIEHGIVDPGERFTGEIPRAAVVVNDPLSRGRFVGTDLLPALADATPLDLFGMRVDRVPETLGRARAMRAYEDLPQLAMHDEIARRRVYLHPVRWTSLGLALIEAMHLGMPVVAVASTEVVEAVPADAGVISTCVGVLADATRHFAADVEAGRLAGKAARAAALERYGLRRFLDSWDALLEEVAR